MQVRLDDDHSTIVPVNGTNPDDGPKLVWGVDDLRDGDHQFALYVKSLQEDGFILVDYFEYVVPSLHFATRIVFQQDFCFQG